MNNLLQGKRILVVEDEGLIAMLIGDAILDEGGVVVGPAPNLDRALALARDEGIDAAVLDCNLAGQLSDPVADILVTRGIPFLFATGYGNQAGTGASGSHAKAPVLGKPFRIEALVAMLERMVA